MSLAFALPTKIPQDVIPFYRASPLESSRSIEAMSAARSCLVGKGADCCR